MKQTTIAKRNSTIRIIPNSILLATCLVGVSVEAATMSQDNNSVRTFHDCQDCPEMVVIPAGIFQMMAKDMSTSYQKVMDLNAHRVSIPQFSIGKVEVTQGQWRAVMGNNPSYYKKCGDNCPVEQVNWDDTQTYIQKLNTLTGKQYRLPTEAEWEYACRAGKVEQDYCGSDRLENIAWYSGNSGDNTHPVSVWAANAWGLYDMSGNVMEWVEDNWHKSFFSGSPTDGSAWLGDAAYHVVRGGASNDSARNVSTISRNYYPVGYRGSNVGFRLATSDTTSTTSEKPLPLSVAVSKVNDKPSTTERLKELDSMHKQGLITDIEYQQKRKQILDNF